MSARERAWRRWTDRFVWEGIVLLAKAEAEQRRWDRLAVAGFSLLLLAVWGAS